MSYKLIARNAKNETVVLLGMSKNSALRTFNIRYNRADYKIDLENLTTGQTWVIKRGFKSNAVQEILEDIAHRASEKGLFLHKYVFKSDTKNILTTYGLHDDAARPPLSHLCTGMKINLTGKEGTTEKCSAFKKLLELLGSLK